jgi:hypothetical protein
LGLTLASLILSLYWVKPVWWLKLIGTSQIFLICRSARATNPQFGVDAQNWEDALKGKIGSDSSLLFAPYEVSRIYLKVGVARAKLHLGRAMR